MSRRDRLIPNDLEAMPRVPFPLDDVAGRGALVGCGKQKHESTPWPIDAELLYTGTYFKEVLAACKAQYSWVFILSAKHGVLALDSKIRTYDLMLPWSDRSPENEAVIRCFRAKCLPPPRWWALGHRIDIHAGRNYARWFQNHNPDNATIRWADWGPIGFRRQKYKELR